MGLTQVQLNERYNAKKKDIQEKANEIVKTKIRRIVRRDKFLYNSLFAFQVVKKFANDTKQGPTSIIMLLLMDLYHVFTKKDAKLWGIYNAERRFFQMTKSLIEQGYASKENVTKGANYFLTLKGKLLVKEFNEYYDGYVTKIFKSIGNGDSEAVRKVLRVKSARIYKPRDQSTSDKPAADSGRKNPRNNHRC